MDNGRDNIVTGWTDASSVSLSSSVTLQHVIDTAARPLVIMDGDKEIDVLDFIKEMRGQSLAILKCGHCGQWGAKYCACRYCGAPIG
jgi:hypothetical protein